MVLIKTMQLGLLLLLLLTVKVISAHEGMINVQDYGALGDDTDQTQAISNAINAAFNQTYYINASGHGGASEVTTDPAVYFPPGRYRLDGSLNLIGKHMRLVGDRAILRPVTNPMDTDAPAIIFGAPLEVDISGFVFIDFVNAIKLGSTTYDVDQGFNRITNCKFVGISGTAIQYGHRSSVLNIVDCRFDLCRKVADIFNCDMAKFQRCWISASALTNDQQTIIEQGGGRLDLIDSIFIQTAVNSGRECAWVTMTNQQYNSHYQLAIRSCRFSGENNGNTLINWKVPGKRNYPAIARGFMILDSNTEGGPSSITGQPKTLVRLYECPNFGFIKNNYGLIGTCPMLWADGVDGSSKVWTDSVNAPLTIQVSGNCGSGIQADGYKVNYILPEFDGKANLR